MQKHSKLIWGRLLRSAFSKEPISNLEIAGRAVSNTPLANSFDDYFSSVGSSVYDSKPSENVTINASTIFLESINNIELESSVRNLQNSCSCDADDPKVIAIKCAIDLTVHLLLHIVREISVCRCPQSIQTIDSNSHSSSSSSGRIQSTDEPRDTVSGGA